MQPCFHNRFSPRPLGVPLIKKFSEKKRKTIFIAQNLRVIQQFSIVLMNTSVTTFRILMIYKGAIFFTLEIFKEFFLDLMLETVDNLSKFYVEL